jgi:hypothetical protein
MSHKVLIEVLHELWANAQTPEQGCRHYMVVLVYRTVELLDLLDLREEQLNDLEGDLWLGLKNFVGDVDEAAMREDVDTVLLLRGRWQVGPVYVVLHRRLDAHGPKRYFFSEHLAKSSHMLEAVEIWMRLTQLVIVQHLEWN